MQTKRIEKTTTAKARFRGRGRLFAGGTKGFSSSMGGAANRSCEFAWAWDSPIPSPLFQQVFPGISGGGTTV